MSEIEKLRKKIDRVDRELLELINERARIALEIGRHKRDNQIFFYNPEREREILEKISKLNEGPLPKEAVKNIYREIISGSRSLEEKLTVAYLGPRATFSHLAAVRHFGSSAELIPAEDIRNVFDFVESGSASYGVVPIENSNEGVVGYNLDMFMEYDLKVSAEIMLEVSHNLLSRSGKAEKVKKIYSHPQPLAQCRQWLKKNMQGVTLFETSSTTRAAEIAAKDETAAAIASEAAAKIYSLKFIARKIEDRRRNFTRFLVIGSDIAPRTGRDKTSIMFSLKDKPGALYGILAPFKKTGINLSKIESRPSKRKAWEYIFFVDLSGHVEDKSVRKALESVSENCLYFKILGSYPKVED
jgi:chorismate mutase/prephenate dehydratase